MGLGGCYGCIKYLMFAFNFLFWMLGCAILGCGLWIRFDPQFEKYVSSSSTFGELYIGSYILLGVGACVMVVGFLGCCGAIRESQILLITFFVFLFLIFAVLVVFGVWAILSKNSLRSKVSRMLTEAARDYNDKESAREIMIHVQNQFECCGSEHGINDYNVIDDATKYCKIYHFSGEPCTEKLFQFIRDNLMIMAGVAIGVGVVMVLGMVFSLMLCLAVRETDYYS